MIGAEIPSPALNVMITSIACAKARQQEEI